MKIADEVKVALVTATCILGLAAISKYVINVKLDFVSQYGVISLFIVYLITRGKAKKSKICGSTLFWSLLIILVTVAILVLYAI